MVAEVIAETQRQDKKWGVREQHPNLWNSILMEEIGEAAEASLQMQFDAASSANYETELIQAAAVAVQAAADLRARRKAIEANAPQPAKAS